MFFAIALLLRFKSCSPFLGIGIFLLQAKADSVVEPILAEAVASAAAEEGPEGEDRQAGGTVVPPSSKDGRGAANEARCSKTIQWRLLLALRLSRCEGRGS